MVVYSAHLKKCRPFLGGVRPKSQAVNNGDPMKKLFVGPNMVRIRAMFFSMNENSKGDERIRILSYKHGSASDAFFLFAFQSEFL